MAQDTNSPKNRTLTHTSPNQSPKSNIYRLPYLITSRPQQASTGSVQAATSIPGHRDISHSGSQVHRPFAKFNDITVYTTPHLPRYGIANPSKIRWLRLR
ncbi:MAG: hypothetical protein RMY29_013520 [Nostoc sp. CreGUA01]|nr:hypothetical protein [Nostoc sp. CreGUA01]